MYFYSNKIIPSIEYLGNIYSGFIYRNERFYSTSLYKYYIHSRKSIFCKIDCRYNNQFNHRQINILSNYNRNDLTSTNNPDVQNNGINHGLCNEKNLQKQSNEPKNTNTEFDNIHNVLNIIKNGNISDIDQYMFESIDKNILSNLDKFSISDINSLLYASLKVFYSQNLIEALILKLESTHPSEIPFPTLALVYQSLGRVLSSDIPSERLEEFLNGTCEHILKVGVTNELYFSSILYGFQRMHYNNHEFLKKAVERYENTLSNPNINSISISLSSLVKLNYFNLNVILKIYSIIHKSTSHMSLQTSIQLATTIYKIHYYYFTDGMFSNVKTSDDEGFIYKKSRDKLYKFNYKLLNGILKDVCDQHLRDLSLYQICLLLDSINKMNYKKITYISKLINCIPSYQAKNYSVDNNINIINNSELVDMYIGDGSSDTEVNRDEVKKGDSINKSNILGSKSSKNKNIYSYMELPECPFNYEVTLKKLQKLDSSHLVLISHSIFGLEYYNEHTLNLMMIIKEIINPILHEMKAKHILLYTLSYINLCFTDYQLQRINIGNKKKSATRDNIKMILKLLDSDNYKHNWFNTDNLINNGSEVGNGTIEDYNYDDKQLLKQIRYRLNRSEWKEELILSSFENSLRHINFIKSSPSMLNLFKLIFSTFINNMYITHYPQYFNLASLEKTKRCGDYLSWSGPLDSQERADSSKTFETMMSGGSSDGKMSYSGIAETKGIPAIIPENVMEELYELYTSPPSNLDNTGSHDENNNKEEEEDEMNVDNSITSMENSELELDYKQGFEAVEEERTIRLNNGIMYIDRRISYFKVDIVIYNI